MFLTTLCYLERDNQYLMLYRNSKKADISLGKYLGVGGKIEKGESPREACIREIKEETGLLALDIKERGIITFNNSVYEDEYIFLYTCNDFSGEISECDEGDLVWVSKNEILNLPLWPGDKYFLKHLIEDNKTYLDIKFNYEKDKLISYQIQ